MDITFDDNELEKLANDFKKCQKEMGPSSITNALATFAMPLHWKMFATCPAIITNLQATEKGNGLVTLTNRTGWYLSHTNSPYLLMKTANTSGLKSKEWK